jgi:Flp pilus assembly pilin Flp
MFSTSAARKFLIDQEGATAVEYSVLLALILMAAITGITMFGADHANMWSVTVDRLNNAMDP